MRIDGKAIAEGILENVRQRVFALKDRGITPTLSVILIGQDPASAAYVRRKQNIGQSIGACFLLSTFSENASPKKVIEEIQNYNQNQKIHGLIVQMPLPPKFDVMAVMQTISGEKDVDGFHQNSQFATPIGSAVIKILEWVHGDKKIPTSFIDWLKDQTIVVLGRGITAGKPIADTFVALGGKVVVVHSQTQDPESIIKQGDIVVSCVGKRQVLTSSMIKKGSIIIGVGLHQDEGKLKGDYDEEDIAQKASHYTPTPGGVGPVNVACLWENVIQAAECTI